MLSGNPWTQLNMCPLAAVPDGKILMDKAFIVPFILHQRTFNRTAVVDKHSLCLIYITSERLGHSVLRLPPNSTRTVVAFSVPTTSTDVHALIEQELTTS